MSSSSPLHVLRIAHHSSCEIRIGTSGWHYKHWLGPFYPAGLAAKDMLARYVERFDTVEINNSFYRLPSPETFDAWRRATPPRFCFAVKGSRYITHRKRLKDPQPALERLMPAVDVLGPKLGPILFQLPPRWSCNLERLAEFLAALPARHRYTFEFRDPSWHGPDVYRLLAEHNAAFCIYELDGFVSPIEVTADFVYVRIDGWRRSSAAVYVYFDNDQAGYAAKNAAELKALLTD